MNYRYNSKGQTLAFGVFPDVSLADARAKRDAARKLLAAGKDPAERRKQDDRAARLRSGCTFKSVAADWIAKCEAEGRAEKTLIALECQDIVGLLIDDLLSDGPLAAHGVDGHDRPLDFEHFQKPENGDDLVGLLADLDLV
jgi:hypothetical protein